MRNASRMMVLLMIAALFSIIPAAAAQDDDPGFASGGPIISSNSSGDPATFNPLYYGDGTSGAVVSRMYPSIITLNPQNGLEEPHLPGARAAGWEFNEDGTVVTITLREDMFWTDGTPVTAHDYVYSTTVVRSGEIDSPREAMWETLADGTPAGGKITDIMAVDDFTVQVTFSAPDCIAFSDINNVPVVPRAEFEAVYGDDFASMRDEPLRVPEVVHGPWFDPEFSPGERVSLLPVEGYADNEFGNVVPNEYILLSVPDTTVGYERFLDGEFTYLSVPPAFQQEIENSPDFQSYRFDANSFSFMAFNAADPADPQPGVDENGDAVDQGLHPIFGDVRVRQALGMAFDKQAMLEGILDGNATLVATHTTPNSWVYDETVQYTFDQEMALELLAEAGWVDDDSDPSTPLICDGCLYATDIDPDFAGSPLEFELMIGGGSETGEQIGIFFDSQMEELGIIVDLQVVDFNGVLVPGMLGQTYDMVLLSWSLAFPVDPDVSRFYGPEADVPGGGFNFVSFNNERLNEILEEARSVPGCDQATRAELYEEAQQILFEEMPYLYLHVPSSLTAVQNYVTGFDPTPVSRIWNEDAWFIEGP
ncbi:MAG: ABC transporter substrate-binding protein [Chloroflexota bacterium]